MSLYNVDPEDLGVATEEVLVSCAVRWLDRMKQEGQPATRQDAALRYEVSVGKIRSR